MRDSELTNILESMVKLGIMNKSEKDNSFGLSDKFIRSFGINLKECNSIEQSFILSALDFSDLTQKNLEKYFDVFLPFTKNTLEQ